MVEGDTPSLDDLLDEGLTLTHMTGYVQPTAEWLAEMRPGSSSTTPSARWIRRSTSTAAPRV
ncbi:hypothetical protein ACFWAA_12405 [Streptomyces sp. NPDC059922]|uniref:hypothetical protein n=1 Tax=Streptomyces sp. NPDC059922 TaxID=3347005 RepID=UPI003661EBE3